MGDCDLCLWLSEQAPFGPDLHAGVGVHEPYPNSITMSRSTHPMQLRAFVHRSPSLSLLTQRRGLVPQSLFTTRAQVPRDRVEDPVEYYVDEEDVPLPPIDKDASAREAKLLGDLSDCSDWDSEGAHLPASVACSS